MLLDRHHIVATGLSLLLLVSSLHAKSEEDHADSAVVEPTSVPEEAAVAELPALNFGGTGKQGTGIASMRLGVYRNEDDGGGNPFLDEKLTVVEPIFIVDYNVNDRLAAWGQLQGDMVSSASIDRLSQFPEQTGASGDYYLGLDTGVRYELTQDRRIGGFVSASTEFDYYSVGWGGNVEGDFAQENATIDLAINGFYDFFRIVRFDGREDEGMGGRTTLSTTLSWYQVIDRKTHGRLGATFTGQWGFLETTYHAVLFEIQAGCGAIVDIDQNLSCFRNEELPSSRYRGAVFGEVRRLIKTGTAFGLGGRYYRDSWALESISVEPQLFQTLFPDRLQLRLGYRFTHQGRNRYFRDHFRLSPPRFRTQDPDLASFDVHGFGIKLDWKFSESLRFDVTSDYVQRSDGIDYYFGSLGVTKNFTHE